MEFARPNRRIGAGKHPLTKVFPGLDADPGFVGLFPDGARREVLAKCYIEAVPEDMYMHVLRFISVMPVSTVGTDGAKYRGVARFTKMSELPTNDTKTSYSWHGAAQPANE